MPVKRMDPTVFLKVMGVLWFELLIFALTIWSTTSYRQIEKYFLFIVICQFMFLFAIIYFRQNVAISLFLFTLFSIMNGLLLSANYHSIPPHDLMIGIASTLVIFVLMTVYAIAAMRMGFIITGWTRYLQLALIALIAGMLMNIVFTMAGYSLLPFQRFMSVCGIILFSIYIAYDIQYINETNPVMASLRLFLDLVNLSNFMTSSR